MTDVQQRAAARQFAADWKDRGDEKQETQAFWLALLQKVFGVEEPEKYISFERRVEVDDPRTGKRTTKFIDGYIPQTRVLVEQNGKDIVLTRGYKYTPIGLNQRDAQYIESRTFAVEEVSRFTGIPKHMLQSGKESYESNQQQRIVFVTDTLMPYVVQWEEENTYKALDRAERAEGLYFKGNPSVLLRGDDKSRAEYFEKMVQNGLMCPDECRALDERNPIPGGQGRRFWITKNLAPME